MLVLAFCLRTYGPCDAKERWRVWRDSDGVSAGSEGKGEHDELVNTDPWHVGLEVFDVDGRSAVIATDGSGFEQRRLRQRHDQPRLPGRCAAGPANALPDRCDNRIVKLGRHPGVDPRELHRRQFVDVDTFAVQVCQVRGHAGTLAMKELVKPNEAH